MSIDEEIKIKQNAQEYYEKDLSYNQVYRQGVIDGYTKAIDEFAEKLKWEYRESIGTSEREIHFALAVIDQVAEKLKGGAE